MLWTENAPTTNTTGDPLLCRLRDRMIVDDERSLVRYLQNEWPNARLIDLLHSENVDVVRTAAAALGLVGSFDVTESLSTLLGHDDFFVVMDAEQSLWNIWFRASSTDNARRLRRAVRRLQEREYEAAAAMLERILDDDPKFAEAINQRAVLHYLTGQFERSIIDCFHARQLNPWHFGAAAGIGHNLLRMGRYEPATDAYRLALQIHPRMSGVRQALRQARELHAAKL